MTAPLTPHAKAWNLLSRRRPRRGRVAKPTPCGIADCPGWKIVNSDLDPEIQRCDACWLDFDVDEQLTDGEAALLEGARVALREARANLAKRRELAIARRRVAVVRGRDLRCPSCDSLVRINRILTLFGCVEVRSSGLDVQTMDEHESGSDVACSGCARLLQLPPGFVL